MKKVYVVTQGSYSDYHICGIFDSRELAELFINSFTKHAYSEMEIEEHTVNPYEIQLQNGLKACFIRISYTGVTSDFRFEDSDYGFENPCGMDSNGDMYFNLFARDEEHAIKIVNDRRVQLIAENKWRIK